MDLRIGTTLDRRPAGFDTASAKPLVLVGDPGRGKTTWARYIVRWWLADTARHVHVFAAWAEEWADMDCRLASLSALTSAVATGCAEGTCLVVVDDIDHAPAGAARLLPLGRVQTLITSRGGNLEELESLAEDEVTCLGLVRPSPFGSDTQGRLDWPSHTVTVLAEPRGTVDFPCHRWHHGPLLTTGSPR